MTELWRTIITLIPGTVLIYFLSSLVNVMLSTTKSILTLKSSKFIATVINAVTYSFYVIVVKQLTEISFETAAIVTFVTNIIGVYTSMWILEKVENKFFRKEKLWKICITSFDSEVMDTLDEKKINYMYAEHIYRTFSESEKTNAVYLIDIFSKSREYSSMVKQILKNYDVKYHVIEIEKEL